MRLFLSDPSVGTLRGAIVLSALALTVVLALAVAEARPRSKVFPYPVYKKTLPNGLDVIVIETPEFKNVLSYNTLVLAGSRNETEPGKTGLAHLFEHILFRHRFGGRDGGYQDLVERLGAHNNAWTWFDVTYYHPLTFTSNLTGRKTATETLPGLIELESSRFKALDFTEEILRPRRVPSSGSTGAWRRFPP
jgi:zinc protease